MQITAAVSRAPDSPFTLESVDLDAPRPDEVLVRISATGLCHTDLSSKSRIPGPAVLGHMSQNGTRLFGSFFGQSSPEFIPELLALHVQGKFPMEALVRRYDAGDIEAAVADSRSGEAIKPVLVW